MITISHLNAPDVLQACTGLRYIVGPLADPAAWNNEGHNRTIYGVTAEGKLLVLCTEGAYPNQGPTLQECREFMAAHGAILAADFGGGGDVTAFDKNDGLLIATQNGTQTYLPNFMTFTAKETQTMAKNKVTITWNDGARERQKPRIKAEDTYGAVLADNTVHYSDFDVVPDMDYPTNPDKKWIQLQSGWYIAVRYPPSSGTIYERARVEAIAPPVTDSITIDIAVHDVKVAGDEYGAVGVKLTKKA
jgi:hypothetical protein